jgi:hypothetical protein
MELPESNELDYHLTHILSVECAFNKFVFRFTSLPSALDARLTPLG